MSSASVNKDKENIAHVQNHARISRAHQHAGEPKLQSQSQDIHAVQALSSEVASLRGQVAKIRERETQWQQRLAEAETERRCVQALWHAERQRQALMRDAVLSTVASASSDLKLRLTKTTLR